jgi:HEAT repeat protein
MSRSADALAREHTESAIAVLAEALEDDDTKYRIAAANSLLDRGHGKPLTATIQIPTTRAQAMRLAAMTDEEIMAAIKSTPLPQLAAAQLSPEEYAAALDGDALLLEADLDPLLA